MSGGSRAYCYCAIREHLAGRMYDAELDDLMSDIAELAHAVEWYDSGDTCEKTYREEVAKFKKKWFKSSRSDRLKGYVDTKIGELKTELYQMISTKRGNGEET